MSLAVLTVSSAAAGRDGGGPPPSTPGHKCLVMTGSGDPAFIKNFNPYTATRAAERRVRPGRVLRAADRQPVEGGLKPVPVARAELEVEQRQQDPHAQPREERQVVGRQAADVAPTSSTASPPAGRTSRWTASASPAPTTTSPRSRRKGRTHGRDQAQDGRLAVHRGDAEPRSSSSRSTSGRRSRTPRRSRTRTRSAPGPFNKITRFTTQDYVFNKNPNYWQKGAPKIPCLEYVQAASNDAALALIQSGQVDWTHNFVPNVAAGVHREGQGSTTTRSTRRRRIRSRSCSTTTQYPYSLVAFRKALSLAIDRNSVSKLGEYGYAPPTDAIGLNGLFPKWVDGRRR